MNGVLVVHLYVPKQTMCTTVKSVKHYSRLLSRFKNHSSETVHSKGSNSDPSNTCGVSK